MLGGSGSTGVHVLVALPDAFDRILIVLALPFEIIGKNIVKSVGSTLAVRIVVLRAPPCGVTAAAPALRRKRDTISRY